MPKITKVTIHSAKVTIRAELDKEEAQNLLTINEEALAQGLAAATPAEPKLLANGHDSEAEPAASAHFDN